MELVYIYGLVEKEKNVLRYIGKTTNLKRRLKRHISERFLHNSYKDRWIRKLVDTNKTIDVIILDEVPKTDWQYW